MASPSRSLADDIRGRSDAELIDLVLARPDLARPAPADLTSLAARASTRASVQRAVEALDRGHLQVLEVLVVLVPFASHRLASPLADLDRSRAARYPLPQRTTPALPSTSRGWRETAVFSMAPAIS